MTRAGNPKVILQIRTVLPSSLPDGVSSPGKLAEALRVVLSSVPTDLPSGNLELSITLIDDPGIRAINKAHRGVDSPTDVLSFPLLSADPHPSDVPISLGDIVISIDTISRQASERGLPLHERFAECLVHGILHILGWEHSTDEGREKMEEIEDKLVPSVAHLFGFS